MKPNILTQYCAVYLVFCFPQHRFSSLFSLDHNATIQSAVYMKVMSLILAIVSILPEFFVVGEMDPNEGLKQGTLLPIASSSFFLDKENMIYVNLNKPPL